MSWALKRVTSREAAAALNNAKAIQTKMVEKTGENEINKKIGWHSDSLPSLESVILPSFSIFISISIS